MFTAVEKILHKHGDSADLEAKATETSLSRGDSLADRLAERDKVELPDWRHENLSRAED